MKDLVEIVYRIGYNDGIDENDYDVPYELLDSKSIQSVSDGYHTFEELYFHRCVLFASLVNQNPDKSWKSKLHEDGTMYPGYFIAGIKTPAGDYSYHYPLEHWDLFECRELKFAPRWDFHQPKDVTRLLSL